MEVYIQQLASDSAAPWDAIFVIFSGRNLGVLELERPPYRGDWVRKKMANGALCRTRNKQQTSFSQHANQVE